MRTIGAKRNAVTASTLYCKVDDSGGPIRPGDPLVPSETTFGHAMRGTWSADDAVTIGKALAPFQGGCGLIPITVTQRDIRRGHAWGRAIRVAIPRTH